MPQVLLHPPEADGNTQYNAKHRPWLPPWLVTGGAPGRPQQPPIEPEPSAPVNVDLPVISGTAQQGQTLLCSPGTWDFEPTEFTYKWMRGSTTVGNQDFYSPVAADVGSTLICSVTAINIVGITVADSAPSSTILPTAPTNTILPQINGVILVGDNLTCSQGTWTGNPTGYSYQWISGSSMVGTNSNTYTLVAADETNMITCIVTATNAGGSRQINSTPVGPIQA